MSNPLSQSEADKLFALNKYYKGSKRFSFPTEGGSLRIPLHSKDNREEFSLDIHRSSIKLIKNTFQSRARKDIILARIDLNGPPHRNPDGKEINCPHLHLYREKYGDKWAFPLPKEFTDHQDINKTLGEFIQFCNIITPSMIKEGLFI